MSDQILKNKPSKRQKTRNSPFCRQSSRRKRNYFHWTRNNIRVFARELPIDNIRVVTNSLPVFLILSERKLTDLILIGGNYRDITGAFVGTLTLQNLSNLQFSKAFVSCNGIQNGALATFSEEEGEAQRIALNNSNKNIYSQIIVSSISLIFILFIMYQILILLFQILN